MIPTTTRPPGLYALRHKLDELRGPDGTFDRAGMLRLLLEVGRAALDGLTAAGWPRESARTQARKLATVAVVAADCRDMAETVERLSQMPEFSAPASARVWAALAWGVSPTEQPPRLRVIRGGLTQ